jgi:hypothetical protein
MWKPKCRNMGVQAGDNFLYTLLCADDQEVVASDSGDF